MKPRSQTRTHPDVTPEPPMTRRRQHHPTFTIPHPTFPTAHTQTAFALCYLGKGSESSPPLLRAPKRIRDPQPIHLELPTREPPDHPEQTLDQCVGELPNPPMLPRQLLTLNELRESTSPLTHCIPDTPQDSSTAGPEDARAGQATGSLGTANTLQTERQQHVLSLGPNHLTPPLCDRAPDYPTSSTLLSMQTRDFRFLADSANNHH